MVNIMINVIKICIVGRLVWGCKHVFDETVLLLKRRGFIVARELIL